MLERLRETRVTRHKRGVYGRERGRGRVHDWREEELARGEADGQQEQRGEQQAGKRGVVRGRQGVQAGEVGGEVHGQPAGQAGVERQNVRGCAEDRGRQAERPVVHESLWSCGHVRRVARAEEPDGDGVCDEGDAEGDGEREDGDFVEGVQEEGVGQVGEEGEREDVEISTHCKLAQGGE